MVFPQKQFPFTSEPLGGIVSHLREKCGGNVHDKGPVDITASRVSTDRTAEKMQFAFGLRRTQIAALEMPPSSGTIRIFCRRTNQTSGFPETSRRLRIEPRHYTIRTYRGVFHLKSWAVEDSDDGASWTEIDRRENNSDLNACLTLKTFAVLRPGSFRRIRVRQTGPSHNGCNYLVLSAFKVFGAVAGLQ
jgi:hypothetical protein